MALDDIEDVVKYDPNRWTGYHKKKGNPKLRPFVLEVIEYLKDMKSKKHAENPPRRLDLVDYSRATSAVYKRGYSNTRKSEVIHVYRDLVREKVIEGDHEIEQLFIKKLSKSTFGGVNLSIFLPPGHNSPMWSVRITKSGDQNFHLEVIERKSVYTLVSYLEYCGKNVKKKDDSSNVSPLSFDGEYDIITLNESVIEFGEAIGKKNRRRNNIFDIVSLDNGNVNGLKGLSLNGTVNGLIKGNYGIKSCTFGCVYCPNEVDKEGNQINPKSYLTHEPGVRRAVQNDYSTTSQVYDRITTLMGMGHECGKVFVRCVGGTWSVFTSPGQESFIRDIFYALNTVDKPLSRKKLSLAEEQLINETAICRAVEICIEDHPKMISYKNLKWARRLGITAIEMGLQTTDDAVHRLTKRDCTRAELIDRAMICKEFGFKVLAHIMPDLPGSSPEKDKLMIDDVLNGVEVLRIGDYRWLNNIFIPLPVSLLFYCYYFYYLDGDYGNILLEENHTHLLIATVIVNLVGVIMYNVVKYIDQTYAHITYYLFDFDRWKLYPTMVLEFSELKQWYNEKKFVPYFESQGPESLYGVIEHFMTHVKPYQRVERIIRDVPASPVKGKANYVVAGVNVTNAQQIVHDRMKVKSMCLRTREINANYTDVSQAAYYEYRYYANRGEEWFLSFETKDRRYVYGFLKLRFNNGPGREKEREELPDEIKNAAVVRWLQVYGRALAIGGGIGENSSQHIGFGRRLMQKAEDIAKKNGYNKIVDISGVGVRNYYREKLGYRLVGTYMVKNI
jgi:histone acetyltransferase (RNA polymerase elongator complex component)